MEEPMEETRFWLSLLPESVICTNADRLGWNGDQSKLITFDQLEWHTDIFVDQNAVVQTNRRATGVE